MKNKLRTLLTVISFALLVFVAWRGHLAEKAMAIVGDLQLGSQTTSTTYINNDAIYNSNLYFGSSAGRGGVLRSDGVVMIVPTGVPTNLTALIVNDRTKTDSMSVGTSNNTKKLEVGGDSNFQGNVGVGVGAPGTLATPLTVHSNNASPALITLEGSDGTTHIGEYAAGIRIGDGDSGYFYNAGQVTIGNSAYSQPVTLRGSGVTVAKDLTVSQGATVNGVLSSNGGLSQDGSVILNGTDTWLRTTGATGWLSASYGGGWYMTDTTWIRTYGSKSIYQNTGTLRTDGTLQVGNAGDTFDVDNGGNLSYRTNVLFANTTGNVGVGTGAPAAKLHVSSGNSGVIQLGATGTTGYYANIQQSNNDLIINANGDTDYRAAVATNNGSGNLLLYTGAGTSIGGTNASTEKMRVTSLGNVGIGSTAPNYKLEVAGEIRSQSRLSANQASDVGGSVSIWNTSKTLAGQTNNWTIWNMTGGYGNALKFWRYNGDGTNAGAALTLWDSGLAQFAGSVRGAGGGNSLRIDTGNGFMDVGPQNASYAHFGTDRPAFYFDHQIQVNGSLCRYGGGCAPIAGDSNQGDWQFASNTNGQTSYPYASIELRESNFGGSSAYTPPRLSFHWGGVVASQIGIESSGQIAILNNPGTGYENLRANRMRPNMLDFTYAAANLGATGVRPSINRDGYNTNSLQVEADYTFWRDPAGVQSTTISSGTYKYFSTPIACINAYNGCSIGAGATSIQASNANVLDLTVGTYDMWGGMIGNLTVMGASQYGIYTQNSCCAADTWFRIVRYDAKSTYHDLAVGRFYANGAIRFDIAEVTPVDPDENLVLGEIVSPEKNRSVRLHRSDKAYDPKVVGIVSDVNTASMTIGGDTGPEQVSASPDKRPIALGGRVTTIVNLESGAIETGDSIAVSSIPGQGMKAVKAGVVISKALEPFDGSRTNSSGVEEIIAKIRKEYAAEKPGTAYSKSLKKTLAMLTAPLPAGTGRIISFISSSQYDPDAYLADTGDYFINRAGEEYKLQNKSGSVIDRVGAFAELVTAKMKAGVVETQKLIVGNMDVAKKLEEMSSKLQKAETRMELQDKRINELEKQLMELKSKK